MPVLSLSAALLAIAALIYTLWVRDSEGPQDSSISPTQHLEDRRAALYESLRELDFEYNLGKLSEPDYRQTRQDLQRELAAVNAEIQRLAAASEKASAARKPSTVATQPAPAGVACPNCGARFAQPLKYCGECGKPMPRGQS